MRLSRNFVTPLITTIFIVVAVSGVLMFFHLFDGYTEVVHEILGLFFVIFSGFHIILNWNALKIHFKKRFFMPAAITVVALSVLLIVQQSGNPKFDTILYERIANAPVGDVLKVLQVDSVKAVKKLEANGISYKEETTMKEIWMNNNLHPQKVFDLIME